MLNSLLYNPNHCKSILNLFPYLVSSSLNDGGSSIVAQLAAAHQNQQISNTKTVPASTINSLISLSSALNGQPHIHTAKLAVASSAVASSAAGTNLPKPIVISNSNSIISNGLMTNSDANVMDNESKMLLRDYVNLPPPPPYPGTVSSSSMTMASSVAQATPIHGHSTSNVSAGSSGMYKKLIPFTICINQLAVVHI